MTLFDPGPPQPPQPELTYTRRRTILHDIQIAAGHHPATGLPLANNGHTCRTCTHATAHGRRPDLLEMRPDPNHQRSRNRYQAEMARLHQPPRDSPMTQENPMPEDLTTTARQRDSWLRTAAIQQARADRLHNAATEWEQKAAASHANAEALRLYAASLTGDPT